MSYKSTKRLTNFEEVSKEINKLIDAVNSYQVSGGNASGKEGDIRIAEGNDKRIYLEIRGRYGWYTSCTDVFQFKGYTRPVLESVTNGTALLYVAKQTITNANVPSTFTLGTIPAGYTLTKIFGNITTGFTADNRISFSDGSTLIASNLIDITVNDSVFDIPLNKAYTVATAITCTLSGTNSTGAGKIYLEAVKEV